ncbi:EAL domain-containing protein [Deinococcus sp.]|uniref:sensor domain-containing protein n=1 Tax=Deinococcus sp. TaxID=47478 RepID=UPI0025BD3DDF|nr:EAL domain-containing protein [Deinococcus sp.]
MSASSATDPALHLALRDLLRTQAPGARLLASVGQRVFDVRGDGPLSEEHGTELVPPDDWLSHGDLAWITRDGALLGLLWSEDAPVPPGAVHVLTLLLSAASTEGANREVDMLITQLPAATAWLSADLSFRQVSRSFLEVFGLAETGVIGQPLSQVFPEPSTFAAQLGAAAGGRQVRLRDEQIGGRWIRGEAKPYFGGAAAGVLWTSQDVSPEYVRLGELAALLDTDVALALLDTAGKVQQFSRGLGTVTGVNPEGATGIPIWDWSCFGETAAAALRGLVEQAATTARAEILLAGGCVLPLTARRNPSAPDCIILEGPVVNAAQAERQLASQALSMSDAASLMLDHAGRTQLVSQQAAALLELDAAQLTGLSLSRVAGQMGVRVYTPEGAPLPLPEFKDLTLPKTREVLIGLPGGVTRHMEVRLTSVEAQSGKKPGILLTLNDLTALRRAQAKLRHDAVHDPLTGLLNRAGLRTLLTELNCEGSASGMVACLDIDGFGALNAALGRTAGDLLLIQVAARLNDLAAEHGGRTARLADDAFAIYLPELAAEVGGQLLRAALGDPLRAGRRLVPVTFTLGTADVPLQLPEQGLADADMALQYAKRQGRGQVQHFNSGLRDQEAETFELEADLQQAVSAGQFTLMYQPSVSLKDGWTIGAEALLRWTHPRLGNISPARFIPLASRSNLITEVGEWVLHEAGRGRALIREATGQSDWRTSVNLSLEELRRPGAAQRLLPLMSKQNALDVEVSAGSLLDHSSETLEVLESLRSKGSRLIVDDFGDGNSSLSALTRFPLSGLKLHPTLTTRLPGDEKSLKLVQGTISLAHSLGLTVTAVGVETYAQLDVLRDLGCDAAQGYAITPPLAVDDLAVWLKSRVLPEKGK